MTSTRSFAARYRPRTGAAILAAGLLAFGPAAGVFADEVDGAITGVSISATTAAENASLRLDLTWAVPDNSQAGDTFTLTLPPEL